MKNAASENDFVRGQLKHYGVPFEESDIEGRKAIFFLRKALQDGRCDEVPDHISQLGHQLHLEWLDTLSPSRLAANAEWVMQRYFPSSDQPNNKKTTTVVEIPFQYSYYVGAHRLREAAGKRAGLHHETGKGPKTHPIFLGWDEAAVSKAAKDHVENETKTMLAAELARVTERNGRHADYLRKLQEKTAATNGSTTYSPVGSYIVDCKEIETQWPDDAGNLTMDIQPTQEPGIFEARFDFGMLVGVMRIGESAQAVKQYCAGRRVPNGHYHRGCDCNDDEDDDDEDADETPTTSSKRKAKDPAAGQGRPPKKAKADPAQPLLYHLLLRCQETGEGDMTGSTLPGSFQFDDGKMTSFSGKADLEWVGDDIDFSARKTSDTPCPGDSVWEDF